MSDKQPKKAKRKAKDKTIPEAVQKAAAKVAKEKVDKMAKMAGGDPTLIWNLILDREKVAAERKLLGTRDREINAKIKANGYNLGAVNNILGLRRLSPDVLLNRIEDMRQIVQSCPDMQQYDIWGIKAIQKYVDEQKKEGKTPEAKEATPETVARSMMGHNSNGAGIAPDAAPEPQGIATPTPRRVSEIVTH